ncbi:MAG: SH3 domain-containing protein [Clostridiales bacterium]|nr:SH3 domain-containing protein [Clostridiales bacterium]MBR4820167.1 SH3 domain-containing protein [Clostridiales bacterium]MBR5039868.1 SH3 domain-containing protein [Clostridiales bacterium]MBR5057564.1 SH3 domain-containing protein [Clostridiales bacterium]
MKRSSIIAKALGLSMACSMVLAITACGGKGKEESSETPESTTETTPMVTVAPTTVETTLLEYGMTIQENDQAVTWKEEAIEAKIMYANVKTYLNVRKGPGPDYAGVAKFSKGMQIVVVAKTENGWYKTDDGFYVSGEYLSETVPS